MLEIVTKGFLSVKNRMLARAQLTAELIDESLRDIRVSLLEADVALEVVKKFVVGVREKASGTTVKTTVSDKSGRTVKVSAGDHFIKTCHDELEALMGPVDTSLNLKPASKLSTLLLVGLQGSGKTTAAAKLAHKLQKEGRKILLVAADIYRPAAVEQLQVLGAQLEVPVFHESGMAAPQLVTAAQKIASRDKLNTLIIDTAGRLAIDEPLMVELEAIAALGKPDSTLLVVDAMIGQDAVKTAVEFNRRLALDGIVLTKLDGDARGGAALSMKAMTGKPIKFIGMGEGLDKLEEFRPGGLAGRILGFGDVVGLMKDFEQVVEQDKAEEDAEKLLSGRFNMQDFMEQIRTLRKMGSLQDVFQKMPFLGGRTEQLHFDEKELDKIEALYNSMTAQERREPHRMNKSRAQRIAKGAGKKSEEVQQLMQKFHSMQQMMGAIGKNPGLLGRLPFFKELSQFNQMKNPPMGALNDPMLAQTLGMTSAHKPAQAPYTTAGFQQLAGTRMHKHGSKPLMTDAQRKAMKEKRKREKLNRKKNRRS